MIRAAFVAHAMLAGLALGLPTATATAAVDWKAMHGSNCMAGGTNTTPAEITVGAYGVANPGTTDEMVICPLPIDADSPWSEVAPTTVQVRFRAGAVPGRLTCVVFSGTAGAQDAPITTATVTSAIQPANSPVASIQLTLPRPEYSTSIPVVCILSPKVKLGGLFLAERVATHDP